MIIVGLTGSIGMGKSTLAAVLRRRAVPVFDADAAVRALQAPGGSALAAISATFPGVVGPNGLDRAALAAQVFGQPAALHQLESLLYPLLAQMQQRFLAQHARRRARCVALDIPLLFEKGGWQRCDAVFLASAPLRVQRQRVLARPGMTAARFEAIRQQQWPDRQKRRHADALIPTGLGKDQSRRALLQHLQKVQRLIPIQWPLGVPGKKTRPKTMRHQRPG